MTTGRINQVSFWSGPPEAANLKKTPPREALNTGMGDNKRFKGLSPPKACVVWYQEKVSKVRRARRRTPQLKGTRPRLHVFELLVTFPRRDFPRQRHTPCNEAQRAFGKRILGADDAHHKPKLNRLRKQ
jgi:hypothetical protein